MGLFDKVMGALKGGKGKEKKAEETKPLVDGETSPKQEVMLNDLASGLDQVISSLNELNMSDGQKEKYAEIFRLIRSVLLGLHLEMGEKDQKKFMEIMNTLCNTGLKICMKCGNEKERDEIIGDIRENILMITANDEEKRKVALLHLAIIGSRCAILEHNYEIRKYEEKIRLMQKSSAELTGNAESYDQLSKRVQEEITLNDDAIEMIEACIDAAKKKLQMLRRLIVSTEGKVAEIELNPHAEYFDELDEIHKENMKIVDVREMELRIQEINERIIQEQARVRTETKRIREALGETEIVLTEKEKKRYEMAIQNRKRMEADKQENAEAPEENKDDQMTMPG